MLNIFIKNSLIYTIPGFINRGMAIILVPLNTRILSPADYGVLDLFVLLGTLINLTIAFRIDQGVAIYYAESKTEAQKRLFASTALHFHLLCYAVFALAALSGASLFSILLTGETGHEKSFCLSIAYICVCNFFLFTQNLLRWEMKSGPYAKASIIMILSTACGILILAHWMDMKISGILYAMTLGSLCAAAYSTYHLRNRFGFLFDTEKLRKMLNFSTPLIPAGVLVFISAYTDRLMINYYMSLEDVALYGMGFRVASLVSLLIIGFRSAFLPLVIKSHQEPETPRQTAEIFYIALSISLFLFASLSLFAQEILWILATPAFYGGAIVVPFITASLILANMYMFSPGIMIEKKSYITLWINFFVAAINIGLNIILIPYAGIVGAAAATLLANLCAFILYVRASQKYYFIPYDWKKVVCAIGLFLPVFAAPYYTYPIEWVEWLTKILALIIYGFILIKLRLINIGPTMTIMKKFLS